MTTKTTTKETPANLLRIAAALGEIALASLDGSYRTCGECRSKRYNDLAQGLVAKRLDETPSRLRSAADTLDDVGTTESVTARALAALGL